MLEAMINRIAITETYRVAYRVPDITPLHVFRLCPYNA
jgi:hypothetical protein